MCGREGVCFCFKQKTECEISACLVGSVMCIRVSLFFGARIVASEFVRGVLVLELLHRRSLEVLSVLLLSYRRCHMLCCWSSLLATTFQFWFTGFFQKLLVGDGTSMTPKQEMGAAFLGGAASGIPCSVWELTMIQLQRFGGSLVGCVRAAGGRFCLFRRFCWVAH